MPKKRLTIGLFICHLDNDYAYDICKGVDYACKELDVNLVIFPGMYINAAYNDPANAKYDYQYNSVFYYANPEALDALIVSIGTIGSFLSEADNVAFLDRFKDIPILTLESEYENYSSIVIDSTKGLQDVINHLIHHHNKKRIGFVSGRKGNTDAEERLNVYKQTIQEAGLPLDENLIVHGNFSEYCEELVEDLLDANPDIDALCFANDQMALGGYNVLSRRGIEIGKDILVTGFDDVPLALALDPQLTTVRANACELGYRSVFQTLELIKTGKICHTRLNSSMIIRESCGCGALHPTDVLGEDFTYAKETKHELIEQINEVIFAGDKDSFIYNQITSIFNGYLEIILNCIFEKNAKGYPLEVFQSMIKQYCTSDLPLYFSTVQLNHCFRRLEAILMDFINDSQKQLAFSRLTNYLCSQLLSAEASFRYNDRHDYKINTWSSSYIARDAMTDSENLDLTYMKIADNLQNLHMRSSYIYTSSVPAHTLPDGSWSVPDTLNLQVYNTSFISITPPRAKKAIPITELFSNQYVTKNRRLTMVLTPIFTKDTQHGVFICEADICDFHHIYTINLEVGTAIKFIKMYDEQQQTNQQLEYTLSVLHEKNKQLGTLSTIDELTGLKNRRGFLSETQTIISAPINDGMRAILLFADMDNLKAVNDQFGHENGDYALRTIATALKTSLRNDDIIGRIGGDEFVAFALLGNQQTTDTIANRIHKKLQLFNESSDKPYYVEASIGIVDFICNEAIDLQTLITKADSALYEAKTRKRKCVLKQVQDN